MNLRKPFRVLALFLFISYTTQGQIVPTDRATAWNPGLNSVGGIPARTTIYKTIKPSGGNDCPIIQAALDSCPSGKVVLLEQGTFKINGNGLVINRSNITLRGAGPNKTRLIKPLDTRTPVILIGTQSLKFMNRALLASDVAKGSYEITLATNPGYTVGELVALNQRPDPNFVNWGCHATEGQDSRCWFNDCIPSEDPMGRPLGQVVEIKSIVGKTLTFSTPIHVDYKVALGARLAKMGDGVNVVPTVKNSGVEDLYVAYGEGGDGGGNIALFGAGYCWVKNVESEKSNGSNINMASSFRCVLRDSYIHSTVNPTPGGAGYGINLGVYAADNLIENNISWNFNKVMVMRAAGGGNVIGYNYMDDGWGAYYPTQPEAGLNASHYAASNFELFEGNESFCFSSEAYWGNESYITVFRNHLSGLRGAHGFSDYKFTINQGKVNECILYYEDIQARKAVSISAGSYYFTFIGNVLGFDGMSIIPKRTPCIGQESKGFMYEIVSPGGTGDGEYVPMWRLDVGMNQLTCNDADKNTKDTKVISTLIRDGNYDFVSKTIKWDRTAQTIPNSLYLTSAPSFFGSKTWPWVTPENNSKPLQGILPAKARFDSIFNGTETAPLISTFTNGDHCGAGTIKLGATANRGTINWYAEPTGGTSLGSGLSFTTPTLSSSKIYYVDATDNGKTTPIRTAVYATIADNPIITSVTNGQSCGSGTVTLKATTDGDKIRWYDALTGGNLLEEGNSFTSPVLTATKTYYIEAINYYCTSPTRMAVTASIVTNCRTQTISFLPLADKPVNATPFQLTATVNSGLPISYTSSDPTIATINGSTVTLHKAGTVTIKASQAGNVNWDPAADVSQTLTIKKAAQIITFNALANKTANSAPFQLTATASSGLAITYTSSDATIASISGSTVTIHKAGTVTITASQSGDNTWEAALPAPQTLIITTATGIVEGKENLLEVYPNPVNDILYFKGEGSKNMNISIFNVTGMKVWSGVTKEQHINVSLLPAGVYILKISSNKETQTIRFVKQ